MTTKTIVHVLIGNYSEVSAKITGSPVPLDATSAMFYRLLIFLYTPAFYVLFFHGFAVRYYNATAFDWSNDCVNYG